MTPIGIDLSLTSSGISCGQTLVALSSSHKGVERLMDIAEQIQNIVMVVDAPIAIIEGYSFASRNSHAHAIGELGGVVRVMLYRNGIKWIDIPPTTRAKFATGRGNASKTEVMSAVSAKTGVVFAGKGADDMCDAWVLEEIGLTRYGQPRASWPESHLRALDKVEWA
jgi:crossover junction endodeoxyribonuclease RuvC